MIKVILSRQRHCRGTVILILRHLLLHIYGCWLSLCRCVIYIYAGLASSDTYMKLAKEQELERQSRRHKKTVKQRTSKSGRRRKHVVADDDQDDDVPVMHVVSTAIDAPEVAGHSTLSSDR